MPKKGMQAVYVMTNRDRTAIKIGVSADPERRAGSFRGYEVYWHSELRDDAYEIEKIAHEHFDHSAQGGEHFTVAPEAACAFIAQEIYTRPFGEPFQPYVTIAARIREDHKIALKIAAIDSGKRVENLIQDAVEMLLAERPQSVAKARNVFLHEQDAVGLICPPVSLN